MATKPLLLAALTSGTLALTGCGSATHAKAAHSMGHMTGSDSGGMSGGGSDGMSGGGSGGMSGGGSGGMSGMSGHGGMTGAAMAGKAKPHRELMAASSQHYGTVVYDQDHFAVYAFSGDHGAMSSCYGACAKAWPPVLTKGTPRVSGLKQSLVGTAHRTDGTLQVTYGGHPLYYWSGDTAKTIMCQDVKLHGGYWYVLKPSGALNMTPAAGGAMAMKG